MRVTKDELAGHERHNRIATEIALRLAKELPPDERLIVVESLVTAIVGTLPFKEGDKETGVDWALDMILKSARERIFSQKRS